MKKLLALILTIALALSVAGMAYGEAPATDKTKVRTFITADWLDDDQLSLVRYLLYANEFETLGIIADKSRSTPYTFDGVEVKDKEIAQHFIDAYAEDYAWLSQNAEGYPTPEYLTSINVNGSVKAEDLTPSDGSEMIKAALLDDDDRIVFVQCWGGNATLGAALKSIQEEYEGTDEWDAIKEKVLKKCVAYHDLGQDNVFDDYIMPNWKGISLVMSYVSFQALGQTPTGEYLSVTPDELTYYAGEWVAEYITNGKSALSRAYHDVSGNHKASVAAAANYDDPSAVVAEGDTPNFLYIYDVGLRSTENPSYGGWGGRYTVGALNIHMGPYINAVRYGRTLEPVRAPFGLWVDAYDRGNIFSSLTRWTVPMENDFAARMQWSRASYDECNHAPEVTIEEGIDFVAHRGDTITLTAKTSDPDGDNVTVKFWQYTEADTIPAEIELIPGEGDSISFTVPDGDAIDGNTIHIIIEATDDGDIPLTRYQRAIVLVKD